MTRATSKAPVTHAASYWQRAQQPLYALMFLLPFLVIYEAGLLKLAEEKSRPIIAEVLLQRFFEVFGVTDTTLSYHLPAFMVVGVLLSLHMARRDAWTLDVRAYIGMFGEAVMLALPLMVFGLVLFRSPPQPAVAELVATTELANGTLLELTQIRLLESIGAGVYEEFVFRLVGIALLHGLLVDVLALPAKWGACGAIAVTSIVFSAVHFGGERNPFHWGKFLFFAVAGVFFAMIYLLRGFGIAAGTHAAYNVYVFLVELAVKLNDG
jgi:hypothetical protein